MTSFAVGEKKNQWLDERMKALGIFEKDLQEKFVRSSGKGGQKVNKTSTCVYLKHLPTGLEVKCMKDRSQSINRFLARRELIKKIERMSAHPGDQDARREQIRKQKQKRRKRGRNKYSDQETEGPGSQTGETDINV
jgi:peptide chain release factor